MALLFVRYILAVLGVCAYRPLIPDKECEVFHCTTMLVQRTKGVIVTGVVERNVTTDDISYTVSTLPTAESPCLGQKAHA